MKDMKRFLVGIAGVLTITASIGTALADRKLLVLIDASGSMTQTRGSGTGTRFEAAKTVALNNIEVMAGQTDGLASVSVYTFHGTGVEAKTAGFVDLTTAEGVIAGLTPTFDATPLAGSMCQVIDILVATGGTSNKVLEVETDGEENNTPLTDACGGLPTNDPIPPFETDSWQNKVYVKALATDIQFNPTLFNPADVTFAAAKAAQNPETAALARLGRASAAAVTAAALTDADFFAILARDTGGQFHLVKDNEPLPVFGDLNRDFCVDRSDALLIARKFGQPADATFDLDGNGAIGFGDYAVVVSRMGQACGQPDPYVARQPIVCQNQTITITGQSIESGGLTIDARGACQLIIKNSLIVSGKNAINIVGVAAITVDNSILVGETAVLSSRGATVLSAANTIFHGKRTIQGAFAYIDRGGNVWE